jgi:antitoxin component of MazEF toxin-antitoxin module
MIKPITRHGNGNAIPLDRTLMEQLGIQPGDMVQLVVSGGSLVVTPVGGRIEDEQFQQSKKKIFRRYAGVLKKLSER